jgi:hypothetical protein
MGLGRKSKRRWFWTIALFLGFFACIGALLGQQDSHRTNFRYLAWKYGRAPQDYKWCLHLMMVDDDLLGQMHGKTMSQLRQWLPETGPAKADSWQADWLAGFQPKANVTYEQIGDSLIAVEIDNGKFMRAFPMKG